MANTELSPSGQPKPLFPQGGAQRAGAAGPGALPVPREPRSDPGTAAAPPVNPGTANCGSRAPSSFSQRKNSKEASAPLLVL